MFDESPVAGVSFIISMNWSLITSWHQCVVVVSLQSFYDIILYARFDFNFYFFICFGC